MEIKFEKNGITVTVTNVEDLVCTNDIPEFVENMLWRIGQSEVLKKRKNTVYGEAKNGSICNELRDISRVIENITFADELNANLFVLTIKDELYNRKLTRFLSVGRILTLLDLPDLTGFADNWGWSDISNWKIWHETNGEKSEGGYHIWIPGLKRADANMEINKSNGVNYIDFDEEVR